MIWGLLLALFVLVGLATLFGWIYISYATFPGSVLPGASYTLGDVEYKIPNLKHTRYKSGVEPRADIPVPMLDKQLIADIKVLYRDVADTLKEAGVDFWVTGGTLIGAVLWNDVPMCYDDDLDAAVRWVDRDYTWSPEFAALLARRGLETFFLRGMSLHFSTREGAALRIRRKGKVTPTFDLFYVAEMPNGKLAKVDAWSGEDRTYNDKETWEPEWLFPLKTLTMSDGLQVPVGQQPEKMLDKQYTPEWRSVIKSPSPMFASHQFAFTFTNLVRAWRVGEVSTETETEKITNPRTRLLD